MKVYVRGIGVFGPGMPSLGSARNALSGRTPYAPDETPIPAPAILNANERRRAVPTVKLALGVASQAVAHAKLDPAGMPGIFASSGGDGETVHVILEALAVPAREISPTRFTNSVHNAPSGYWTIATGCREPATSLCAYDHSFAIGLLEAATQCLSLDRPVLLAAYDMPYPEPLHGVRPISSPFGMALVLAPDAGMAGLDLALSSPADATTMFDPALETLRRTNPAARGLPVLRALALATPAHVILESTFGTTLSVGVCP